MPGRLNIQLPPPSDSQHHFAAVPKIKIPRSTFDRSHRRKSTFNQGYLIPFYVDEALPGDTFSMKATILCRLTTPIKPLMDELVLETFFFAVPNRLLWSHWVNFMGEQSSPADTTTYTVPGVPIPGGGISDGTISDYFGIPLGVVPAARGGLVNALPYRAYNQIYNYWFRDENLITAATVQVDDGPDVLANYPLQRIAKRSDYFTRALPWPQKPLAGSGGVAGLTMAAGVTPAQGSVNYPHSVPTFWGTTGAANAGYMTRAAAGANTAINIQQAGSAGESLGWNNPNLEVLVSNIRFAFQVQHLLERNARGGTRYPELIYAHFGVDNPDARMQRPEYLGGGRTPVVITPIAQVSPTIAAAPGAPNTNATPQGNLAGMGTAVAHGHGFVKSFTEHCTLLGLVAVRSEQTYQQGLNRMWNRQSVFDYFWPELQFTSEQAILNQEIYADGSANDTLTFGYQERYADYRYKPSEVTGKFRSTAATPVDLWHLAQKYIALPTLGQTFIEDQAPMSRVVAVTTEPHFYFDAYLNLRCARPMAVFSVPSLMDHF